MAFILLVFCLSRIFIFLNPPPYYSDVTADYERYANMWYYGLTPYREHLYEYPPLSVPLLEFPLILDQSGIGKYYPNYRAQILLIDIVFFIFLLFTAKYKLSWMKRYWFLSSLIYILLTTLGKDFLYEGLDLIFTATFLTSILLWAWFTDIDKFKYQTITWTLFWLSTAIKFLTLPLLVPLAFLFSGSWLKRGSAAILGFLLVWGIPLYLYGTSLSVSFVYNNARPIKYASFPAYVIKVIDTFTHTEEYVNKAPDFESVGIVSTYVTSLVKVGFPLAIAGVLCWSLFFINQQKNQKFSLKKLLSTFINSHLATKNSSRIAIMLNIFTIYLFTLFITAKTFSQPFHLWYLPLIMIYPYKSKTQLLLFSGAALLMILLDLTPYVKLHFLHQLIIGDFKGVLLRDIFRFLPMFLIMYDLTKDTKRISADYQ